MNKRNNLENALYEMRNGILRGFLKIMGLPQIYNLKTLKLFEKRLNQIYQINRNPDTSVIILTGFYLGETIVKTKKGAKWNTNCLELFDIRVDVPWKNDEVTVISVYPFRRAYKFFDNPEYSLIASYEGIDLQKRFSIDQHKNFPKNQWFNVGNLQIQYLDVNEKDIRSK